MLAASPEQSVFYDEPTIRLFGRTLPKANAAERVAWAILFVGLVTVFSVARHLTPDHRGIGTHEQIPLVGGNMPPCGFVAWSQTVWGKPYPCPSCGFTTTFAYAMHGQVWSAIKNQPFGFFVFCVFACLVPTALLCTIGQVSPLRATDHWPWKWILVVVATFWFLAWLYKIHILGEGVMIPGLGPK